jgi:hypothetical protein
MNSSNTTRRGRRPAGRAAHRVRGGKPAMIKITRTVTSDGPDGQPWPPPHSNALWAVVRRADGYTHWRAIQLAESPAAATDFGNFQEAA